MTTFPVSFKSSARAVSNAILEEMDEESIMQVSCIPNLMERTRVPINFDDEQEDNDFETKNEPVTREETFACIIADDGQCPELKQPLEVRTLL